MVFALDDQFLVHEIFMPWIFGFPETVTFAIYAAMLAIIVLRFRGVLLGQPEASILILALVALGGSMTADVLGWEVTGRRLVEEGLEATRAGLGGVSREGRDPMGINSVPASRGDGLSAVVGPGRRLGEGFTHGVRLWGA